MAGNKLTKADIIDSIYQKTGTNRKDIHAVIDFLIEDIKGALTEGRVVELRGFGTFEIRVRKGRKKARNPKTGDPVSVSAHGVAAFRPGKELKQDVWNIKSLTEGSEAGGAKG
jgi:integration host factor subunit alpha